MVAVVYVPCMPRRDCLNATIKRVHPTRSVACRRPATSSAHAADFGNVDDAATPCRPAQQPHASCLATGAATVNAGAPAVAEAAAALQRAPASAVGAATPQHAPSAADVKTPAAVLPAPHTCLPHAAGGGRLNTLGKGGPASVRSVQAKLSFGGTRPFMSLAHCTDSAIINILM